MSQNEKKEYLLLENHVLNQFPKNLCFKFNDKEWKIDLSGKPVVIGGGGEPKTDLYVRAVSLSKESIILELKISIKMASSMSNIFLGNKIPKERAIQIFGKNWKETIINSTNEIESILKRSNPLDTKKKTILLGWRFDILNTKSGERSGKLHVSRSIIEEIYSGRNLDSKKTDSKVEGRVIKGSGIANYVLEVDRKDINSINDVLSRLVSIDDYILKHSEIYFALKALNLRFSKSNPPKWDGDRPLVVYLKYRVINGKLKWKIIINNPYGSSGNQVAHNVLNEIKKLPKPIFLDVKLN